jgi:hypothetical protein
LSEKFIKKTHIQKKIYIQFPKTKRNIYIYIIKANKKGMENLKEKDILKKTYLGECG